MKMNEAIRIAYLEAELLKAYAELEFLREAVGLNIKFPPHMGLTKNESSILGVLMKKQIALKESIWMAIYSDKCEDKQADPKIIGVLICKMRRKLKELGVEIKSSWGVGYYLTPEDKKKIESLINGNTTKIDSLIEVMMGRS